MPRTCRFLFLVSFKSEKDLRAYVKLWKEGSQIIQDESVGARGTRLHRLEGDKPKVLAIAEWESRQTRDRAFRALRLKYKKGHVVFQDGAGRVSIIGHAKEIATVFPQRRRKHVR